VLVFSQHPSFDRAGVLTGTILEWDHLFTDIVESDNSLAQGQETLCDRGCDMEKKAA